MYKSSRAKKVNVNWALIAYRTLRCLVGLASLFGFICTAMAADMAEPLPSASSAPRYHRVDEYDDDSGYFRNIPFFSDSIIYIGVTGNRSSFNGTAMGTPGDSWLSARDVGAVTVFADHRLSGDQSGLGYQVGVKTTLIGIDWRAGFDMTWLHAASSYSSGPITGSLDSTAPASAAYAIDTGTRLSNLSTLRVGFGVDNFFVTGGLAMMKRAFNETLSFRNQTGTQYALPKTTACNVAVLCASMGGNRDRISLGWALGAGYEMQVWKNLYVTAEYVYVKLPDIVIDSAYTSTDSKLYTMKFRSRADLNIARIGLNYYFSGFGG